VSGSAVSSPSGVWDRTQWKPIFVVFYPSNLTAGDNIFKEWEGRKGKGRKKREGRRWQLRGRTPETAYSPAPVAFFYPSPRRCMSCVIKLLSYRQRQVLADYRSVCDQLFKAHCFWFI